MKTIQLEQLRQRRNDLEARKTQQIAEVNATIGAINLISSFIEEEEAAERAVKKDSKSDGNKE